MSNIEAARKLYEQCKDMDIDEPRELVLQQKMRMKLNFFRF